jgi:hypothetical protein
MAYPFRGVDFMEIDSLFSEQELPVRHTARFRMRMGTRPQRRMGRR